MSGPAAAAARPSTAPRPAPLPQAPLPASPPGAPVRVLVAKVGLDGHDRGAKVVARALRDAGFEAIYTGLHRTPEEIVEIALQEDVQVIGVSILSGAHMTLLPRIASLLRERGMERQVLLVAGGIIPDEDVEALQREGVAAVFGPGAATRQIVEFLRERLGMTDSRPAPAPPVRPSAKTAGGERPLAPSH